MANLLSAMRFTKKNNNRNKTKNKLIFSFIHSWAIYSLVKDFLDKESVEKAVKLEVPRGTEEINLKAFEPGIEAVGKLG